jgi:hypothetical protein
MIEVNDAKMAMVAEIGLITVISKFHNPQTKQVMYNIAIVSNGGTCMFPISKELFEQWILGMNEAINNLDDKKILVPHLAMRN